MDFSQFNMPEAFKNMFDANNETFKKSADNAKQVFEDATSQFETFATNIFNTNKAITEKYFDIAKSNTDAAVAHSRKLTSVTCPSEALEVNTEFARASAEKAVAQSKEFGEIVQSNVQSTLEPVKASVEKAFAAAK